jgi:hypothetical protein
VVHRLTQRASRNKVIVAIANKLARIAWSMHEGATLFVTHTLMQNDPDQVTSRSAMAPMV